MSCCVIEKIFHAKAQRRKERTSPILCGFAPLRETFLRFTEIAFASVAEHCHHHGRRAQ